MKKILIIFLIGVVCLTTVGCKKKEKEKTVGGWQISLTAQSLTLPSDATTAFQEAMKKESDNQYEPIALLGTQVVAGTNYMFLCSYTPMNSTEDSSYKVVIIYKDLKGVSSLSQVQDFDVYQYAGKEISGTSEALSGGWTVNENMTDAKIKEEVMEAFEKATTEETATYTPIVVLAKQLVSGTNYAILTLQEENNNYSIQVLTIYADLNDHAEISTKAYVNLADYNH